jgi:hypothetical protein
MIWAPEIGPFEPGPRSVNGLRGRATRAALRRKRLILNPHWDPSGYGISFANSNRGVTQP